METITKKTTEPTPGETLSILRTRIEIYQKMIKKISTEIQQWIINDDIDDNFRNFMLQSLIAGRKNFESLLAEANEAYRSYFFSTINNR